MSDAALPKGYTADQRQRLTEAVSALRLSPAYKILEQCLTDLLEQRKNDLVTNQTALVPNLQGRAQQLSEIIAILNRKPS